MANEQTNSNEYIAQAVAEAAEVAIQTMPMSNTARSENGEPRMSGPIIKQPTYNWSSKDKYAELGNIKLEVKMA